MSESIAVATPDPDDRIDMTAIEAELSSCTNERLRTEFVECYNKAAAYVARAAMCVKILESRGENLRGIPQVGLFRRGEARRVVDPETGDVRVERRQP